MAELRTAAHATGDECLVLSGYAYRWTINYQGEQVNAARAVWRLAHGDPGDTYVLHTCHRGEDGCISIRHLYLGDAARNMLDMAEAGRGTKANRGELSWRSKLTRDEVRLIRQRYVKGARHPHLGSARALADEFGVRASYISTLASGKRWAWLDADETGQGHVVTATAHTVHVVLTT
ncbi:hypothetical protein [Streptomyces sp. NPDC007346]|uniref:hypothetical protein n=1 Tax=Streptomyces sp. NPDC007346 TaxID=3154682 RepID=UPI003455324E